MVGQDEWFLNFKRSLIHSKISAQNQTHIVLAQVKESDHLTVFIQSYLHVLLFNSNFI